MRVLACLSLLIAVCAAPGCSSNPVESQPVYRSTIPFVANVSYDGAARTVLLVSLEDGTVIKQMIDVDAEICFKQASSSATTCLTEGTPIIDSMTETVIGIEMIENQIDLIGSSSQ